VNTAYERQVIAQLEREFESTIFAQPVKATSVPDVAVFAVLVLLTAGLLGCIGICIAWLVNHG
jgi:hypothetical protein